MLRIWDLRTKTVCYSLGFDYAITALDWSEDEKLIIVGDVRGYIYLYEYEELSEMIKLNFIEKINT